jgi:hypothetical protein
MLFAFEFCIVILQYKYMMGITKTEYFTEEQNELAIYKALHTCSYCYNRASYKSE